MPAVPGSKKSLTELLTSVIELGCDRLEVERKGGYEQITAMKGNFGFGLREIKSDTQEATALRDELWSLRNRTNQIEVQGTEYRARVTVFDSFGEKAYRINIRRAKTKS